jgi:hypothetical protein
MENFSIQINIFISHRINYFFMPNIFGGKTVLFAIFAVLLLVFCGTASAAYLVTPAAISEYPTALSGPSIGYSEGLPLYVNVNPVYTPSVIPFSSNPSPSYTTPGYSPIGIFAPVVTPLPYVSIVPLYSTVNPDLKLLTPTYNSYTPSVPVIPYTNSGSSHSVIPDSKPDTSSSTISAYVTPISSGTILLDNMFPRGLGELNIENARSDKDAIAVLVRSGSVEPLIAVYIKAGETDAMKGILDGNYILYYSLGNGWDPVARQFTRNAEYYRSSTVMTFATTSQTTQTQFKWSWTVYDVTIGYGDGHPVAVGKSGFPAL